MHHSKVRKSLEKIWSAGESRSPIRGREKRVNGAKNVWHIKLELINTIG